MTSEMSQQHWITIIKSVRICQRVCYFFWFFTNFLFWFPISCSTKCERGTIRPCPEPICCRPRTWWAWSCDCLASGGEHLWRRRPIRLAAEMSPPPPPSRSGMESGCRRHPPCRRRRSGRHFDLFDFCLLNLLFWKCCWGTSQTQRLQRPLANVFDPSINWQGVCKHLVDNAPSVGIMRCSKNLVDARE